MNQFLFRKAKNSDLLQILQLIEERIHWMDRHGIVQWNATGYMECYPVSYFERCVENGNLYVAERMADGQVAGAAALLEADDRWEPDVEAYYIHNLVSDCSEAGRGAGKGLLEYFERLAREKKKTALRLDCQAGNEGLNRFYEEAGFAYVSNVTEGAYEGKKREKKL